MGQPAPTGQARARRERDRDAVGARAVRVQLQVGQHIALSHGGLEQRHQPRPLTRHEDTVGNEWHSATISGAQRSSVVIYGDKWPSAAISGHQRHSPDL